MAAFASASTLAAFDTPQILPSAVRWSMPVAARPAAPPIVAGPMVVVPLQTGTIVAHRASDGIEAWHVDLQAEQPLAADAERVLVAGGEAIHALAVETGAVLWRAPAGKLTAPLLLQDGWVVAASANALTAYRAADGSKVWSRESGAQKDRAAIEGDNLYVPLQDGRLLALDLRTGAERWAHPFSAAPGEVVPFADRIYLAVSDQFFYCLEAGSGATAWRFRTGSAPTGRAAANDSRLFVAALDNLVRAFDRRSGALTWHAGLPYRPTRGPVVVGPSVVVPGTEMEFRVLDAASGRERATIKLDERPAVAPAFGDAGGTLVMVAVTGSLAGQWKLVLTGPAPTTIAIEPLGSLPGVIVPVLPPPTL